MDTPVKDPQRWLSLLLLSLAVWLGLRSPLPAAAGADAAPARFSAERALVHLSELASAPHPSGTEENARVRATLVRELEALGLEVALQRGPEPRADGEPGLELTNVIARRAGADSSGLVMFVAHYDSVGARGGGRAVSHGAGDDGAAVAAMLEVARALRHDATPLRNDLVFLVTDGEELGLLGAKLFRGHPLFEEVRVVLNFEGRGVSGPVLMFETSDENAALVGRWARALPDPLGSSLMADIYRRMPNDTDFSVFRDAGHAGLNFAHIGGYQAYHTGRDIIANLDPRTLQHHGESMLALARALGAEDLSTLEPEGAAVYFNPLGSLVVAHPLSWIWPQALAIAALSLVGLIIAARRRVLSWLRLPESLLACAGIVFVATLASWGVSTLALRLVGIDVRGWRAYTLEDGWFFGASACLCAGLCFLALRLTERRLDPHAVLAGGLVLWLALLLAACALLPGGTFIAAWPALGLALVLLLARREGGPRPVLLWVLFLPTLPYLVGTAHLVAQGMTLHRAFLAAPLCALALVPCWPLVRPFGRLSALVPLAAATALFGIGWWRLAG